MRLVLFVSIAFVTVQAFQSLAVPSDPIPIPRPADRRLYKRTSGRKRPISAQEKSPTPDRSARPRLAQDRNPTPGQASRQASSEKQAPRAAQEAGHSRGHTSASAIAQVSSKEARRQESAQEGGGSREPSQERSQSNVRGRSSEQAQRGSQPGSPRRAWSSSPAVPRNRRTIAVQYGHHFPRPGKYVESPARSKPVQIHASVSGPAHIHGYFGQNYEAEEEHIPAGQNVNKLWTDKDMADVTIRTLPGNTGINRAFATGSRRASIRANHVSRKLSLAHDGNIAGPVDEMKMEQSDFGPTGARAYMRVSTRNGPQHVGVDSFSRGPGTLTLRASNSVALTNSRASSVNSESELTVSRGSTGRSSEQPR